MQLKKINLNYLLTIFFTIFLIYFFIDIYENYVNLDSIYNYTRNSYMVKIGILSIVFILFAFVFTIFRFYRRSLIQKNIDSLGNITSNANEKSKINLELDSLTQCLNKKYFLQKMEKEFVEAVKKKQYLSFFIVNIDEFSAFNDIYGNDEGDECMKLIANLLVNYCSETENLVGRIENDEFYVLLSNNNDCRKICNSCVKSVRSLNIPHDNSIASNVLTITISSCVILPTHPEQMSDLISKTKEGLKQAKKNGRNRYETVII